MSLPYFLEKLLVLPQYLMPKQLLTELAGIVAKKKATPFIYFLMKRFAKHYGVNMHEALHENFQSYANFNEFFTRQLKSDARPLALTSADYLSPVDGKISQVGTIADYGEIFQAKRHWYSLKTLLGGDSLFAEEFMDGSFATIYLSPKDYHRIHMPCTGRLTHMIHIPGDLFSVNPLTARTVPNLFARNERLVCRFEGEKSPFIMVLVGATIVGSMATVWHGVVNPPRPGVVREWTYYSNPITLTIGEEMGKFLLGSTVILIFPKNTMQFKESWKAGISVQMGSEMGDFPKK